MAASPAAMRWRFHGLTIEGRTDDPDLRDRWRVSFASRPAGASEPDLVCALNLAAEVPAPPDHAPQFRQGDLIAYYLDGDAAVAYFPRYGQLRLDLARGITEGRVVRAALEAYGVLEDLIAIALSPHLRRRGLFLIHAFAAAAPTPSLPRRGPTKARATGEGSGMGVLIVGDIGAGKTTTGMALLDAGWKLLSNDSPILRAPAEVLSYPGLLAAYPDTYTRFAATAHLSGHVPTAEGRRKIAVAAESVWPGVWLERAPCAAIVFPQIEPRSEHALERLRPPEALRRLLPHAVEQWDKAMLPAHLALLAELVRAAPAYRLRLGPDTSTLPRAFEGLLNPADHVSRFT